MCQLSGDAGSEGRQLAATKKWNLTAKLQSCLVFLHSDFSSELESLWTTQLQCEVRTSGMMHAVSGANIKMVG